MALSYNLNSNALTKLKMNKIENFASAENLFILTKYNRIWSETKQCIKMKYTMPGNWLHILIRLTEPLQLVFKYPF